MNNRAPEGSQQASIMFAKQSPEWKALISDKVNTHTQTSSILKGSLARIDPFGPTVTRVPK